MGVGISVTIWCPQIPWSKRNHTHIIALQGYSNMCESLNQLFIVYLKANLVISTFICCKETSCGGCRIGFPHALSTTITRSCGGACSIIPYGECLNVNAHPVFSPPRDFPHFQTCTCRWKMLDRSIASIYGRIEYSMLWDLQLVL